MVKRAAATLLAAGLLLSSPSWAAEKAVPVVGSEITTKVVQEKAGVAIPRPAKPELTEAQRQTLEKFYQVVPELKELSLRGVHDTGEDSWEAFFSSGDAVPGIQSVHANITFDAKTGELVRFDYRNPKWATLELASPALAKEKATAFARQVLEDKMKDYQLNDKLGYGGGGSSDSQGNKVEWASVTVSFDRMINGIPLLNSGLRVEVDAAGHITSFDRNKENGLDPAKFPDPSRTITRDAAQKAFAGLVEMKLNYIERQPRKFGVFNRNDETRPVLMYTPSFPGTIDATTGKQLEGTYGDFPPSRRVTLNGKGKKLVVQTPEEASELLAGEFGLNMAGLEFIRVNVQEEGFQPGIKIKHYSWRSEPVRGADGKPDYSNMRHVFLRTLADSGQVLDFNTQDDSGRGEQGVVSREAAEKTAIGFLQRYLKPGAAEMDMLVFSTGEERIPAWVDKSKLKEQECLQRPEFSFYFNGTYQGIPVSDRYYNVQVDAITGKVAGFHCNGRATVALPDSKGVVTAEAAKAEYLKNHPLNLAYMWPEYFDQKAPAPYLIYYPSFMSGDYIDAFTGKTVVVERN
ncbi:MAG: DUF4901 domain-containing protein [Heliobacteriaceae bacterium]|nr:DUF4901 domain-containing protein [Heliobacteriaceae bacterium]